MTVYDRDGQIAHTAIHRRCGIYTLSLTSLTSGLALLGMVLAVGVVALAFLRNEHLAELAEELAVV